jgi:hypothetical protein
MAEPDSSPSSLATEDDTLTPNVAGCPAEVGEAAAPPAEQEVHHVRHTHEGAHYLDLLAGIHRTLQPATYLEIGTYTGDSLKLASCTSIAIDTAFQVTSDIIGAKPVLMAFQTSSDAFFRDHDVDAIMPRGIDLAFLDGLHLFEFLLRDFINVEAHTNWRSAIVLHDCLPPNIEIAERDYRPHLRKDDLWRIYWTGDVWKLVPVLQKYRPDLQLTFFDAPPSGLVMVTGLDRTNTVLRDHYRAILEEYRGKEFDEASYRAYYDGLTLTRSGGLLEGTSLSEFF